MFEVCKIQFIASCKIELIDNLIVAFYIGEYGALYPYILDELPLNYSQVCPDFHVIDYKSYSEICELTGETKLPLLDYIKDVLGGNIGLNSFLEYNGKIYNYDKQKQLWTKLAEK